MEYMTGLDVKSSDFDQLFTYTDKDLGCTYTKKATTLKVWAPTAKALFVELEQGGEREVFPMVLGDKGVYSLTIDGDLEYASYVYEVQFEDCVNRATDPYAIASTANHERTVIVDPNKLVVDSKKADLPVLESYTDAVIYEVHVRDFSTDPHSGIQNRGKFLGFTESGTKTSKGHVSGIDYIASLGVTHVQLLPVYDFGSVDERDQYAKYNWGYDPVQYNVPEGSYASDSDDPYARILELKQAIAYLHSRGLRVIMDVVYNHMYDMKAAAFEKIVPGYYFRHSASGEVSNGSFCGNDIDSLRPMVSSFILESTRMWIEDYGFDGFRFDLMGILDIDTMNAVEKQTKAIDASAMVYGEGWNMPTFMEDSKKAMMDNHRQMPGIAHFSDLFREGVKGGTLLDMDFDTKGYCTGAYDKVTQAMSLLLGTTQTINNGDQQVEAYFAEPTQTLNYVECHDNHTLWDKLEISLKDEGLDIRQKRHRFITSFVLMSQGIPFLHAGQEFFRSKFGEENSFISSDDINMIRWDLVDSHEDNIDYVRQCIQFRKDHALLRLVSSEAISQKAQVQTLEGGGIHYTLSDEAETLSLYVNPRKEPLTITLDGSWTKVFDANGACQESASGQVTIKGLEIVSYIR